MDLTDEQWEVVRPLIPVPFKRTDGRGRPRLESSFIEETPQRMIGD